MQVQVHRISRLDLVAKIQQRPEISCFLEIQGVGCIAPAVSCVPVQWTLLVYVS